MKHPSDFAICISNYLTKHLAGARNLSPNTIKSDRDTEPHPVKRTVKKYKVFPASSRALLAAFYAARQSVCFSIGVSTPRLR